MLTVPQAAERLNLSRGRILVIIRSGRLKAQRIGPMWVIEEADLVDYRGRRRGPGYPKGRPRKPAA